MKQTNENQASASGCACAVETYLPPKNRVWKNFEFSENRVGQNPAFGQCSRRENPQPTTIIVSGVRFYGFRYYDPETGRWPNRDPIGELGANTIISSLPREMKPPVGKVDKNPYGFVFNNPIYWVDMYGRSAVTAVLPFAGGAAAIDGPFPFGDALAASAIVTAGAWDLSQPGPRTGNCSRIKHGILQGAVNVAKRKAGLFKKCRSTDCCPVLVLKAAAWLELALTRSIINQVCFSGGDATHQNEAAKAWDKVGECQRFISANCGQ